MALHPKKVVRIPTFPTILIPHKPRAKQLGKQSVRKRLASRLQLLTSPWAGERVAWAGQKRPSPHIYSQHGSSALPHPGTACPPPPPPASFNRELQANSKAVFLDLLHFPIKCSHASFSSCRPHSGLCPPGLSNPQPRVLMNEQNHKHT